MSLLKKLERRMYGGGYFTDPYNYGLPPGAIPTNGMQGGDTGYAGVMSIQRAMKHPAVYACVRVIADTIAQLPVDLYDKNDEELPFDKRLATPSAYASWTQWIWQVMASELLTGNAYGLVGSKDRLDYPLQVDLISPVGVTPQKNKETGLIELKVGTKTLAPGDFWFLPGPQFPGDIAGLSPISYAARTINLGLEAQQFGSDFFNNGINPTAVLETDQQVNGDQASEIKQRVKRSMAQNDIVVLGAGMQLKPWQLSAQDSQFIDTEIHNSVAIAQIFGVPPEMIGDATRGSSVTYANREQRAQDFLNNAINPWLTRLEESISAWFPRGTYVKFNTGALLKSDLITRYQSYQVGIRNNVILPSEARAWENLPAIDGIDDKPLAGPPAAGAPAGADDTGTGK